MPLTAVVAFLALGVSLAGPGPDPTQAVCMLVLHEERINLENAERTVDLARSTFEVRNKIYEMVAELYEGDAIDRMRYLRHKYNRDAAELELGRADIYLQRQRALIEQYGAACDAFAGEGDQRSKAEEIEQAYLRYREADCGIRTQEIEISRVNLEFNNELLASVLDLREAQVATLIEELDARLRVELEQKRLRWAEQRTEACRRELAGLRGDQE
jgi:hypothetical protein